VRVIEQVTLPHELVDDRADGGGAAAARRHFATRHRSAAHEPA
jgi:hypothetical protein